MVELVVMQICAFVSRTCDCRALINWVSKGIRQLLWFWFWFYNGLRLAE